MKNALTAGAALLLTTSLAQAGGIDRAQTPYSILFEDGNYVQFSFSTVNPEVSGEYPDAVNGGSSGNMAESYTNAGAAFKYALTNQLDLGVLFNQPYGANASYEQGFYDGLFADWGSSELAIVAKYEVAPGISVFGGPRAVQSTAEIAIPDQLIRAAYLSGLQEVVPESTLNLVLGNAPADPADVPAYLADLDGALGVPGLDAGLADAKPALGAFLSPDGFLDYTAETDTNTQVGYVVGAAYERPDIALRVSLTYESGVTHDFESKESVAVLAADEAEGDFDIEMPQSLTLDFQSGIAADTLLFGSVRWTEWSVWEVRPEVYEALTDGERVTGIDDDVMTYQVGLGRRLSDELSVFGRVTYEGATGNDLNRLAPTDGSTSIGLGGSYTIDNIEITGGVEYAMLGGGEDSIGTEFEDNTALGFGLSVGFSF